MQTTIPLYGFGGGTGGTGASLTVTAPAGATVTVSKDGKSKTKVADDSGVAVFKGLSTGEWTVTITDGEQEAQKTVTITADYAAAITFFSATIHVIYPAGSTCTATDGVTTLPASDDSGTWDFVVPNAGTWTVSLDSGFSEQVEVTEQDATYTVDKWHLYHSGNTYDAVTGGWESNSNFKALDDVKSDSPAVFGTDSITLKGSTTYANCVANTVNKVKVGGFSKLRLDLLVSGNTGNDAYGLMSTYGNITNNLVAGIKKIGTLGRNIYTIDVSAITSGEYYVALGLSNALQPSRERTIYGVWFEV